MSEYQNLRGRLPDHITQSDVKKILGADTLLLGRVTYQSFAGAWPQVPDNPAASEGEKAYARKVNRMRKVVFSRTMETADWHNSTIVKGNIGAEVGRLKQMPGRELQVHGSGILAQTLLENDLVDEWRLIVLPVIVGAGRRLFPDAGVATGLRLVDSRTTEAGVAIHVYRPTGRAEFGEVPQV